MRALRLGVHTLKNRLLLGMTGLLFFATLTASLVMFVWGANRLEQERGQQQKTAESAVFSLLLAEQTRISDQLALFGERPTLRALLQAQQANALSLYIQDFRSQGGLDFLAVYGADGALLASNGRLRNYDLALGHGFLLLDGEPLLVAQQIVHLPDSDLPLGTAVAGLWLERPLLNNFAAAADVQLRWSETETAASLPLRSSNGPASLFVEVQMANAAPGWVGWWSVGMITAVLTLIGWLAGWLLLRRQMTSLQKLTIAAQKIGQGNPHAPLPLIAAPTEVRHLATALHRLQAQLITAQQHKSDLPDESGFAAPSFLYDNARLAVQRDGQEAARLTPLEARLLETLMRNPGQVLNSELLITAVWGSDGGDKTMLKQLVYRLRSKIDAENSTVSHIETVSGVGYAFKN